MKDSQWRRETQPITIVAGTQLIRAVQEQRPIVAGMQLIRAVQEQRPIYWQVCVSFGYFL